MKEILGGDELCFYPLESAPVINNNKDGTLAIKSALLR